MSARDFLVAVFASACFLACAPGCEGAAAPSPAHPSQKRPAVAPARLQPMVFYIVKGAPDACGRGCDSWIEAEGKIESSTGARFKAFLDHLRDRRESMPIYFASPGGNLDQAIAMGNMLHAKPRIARVGRTTVRECGFEAQDSDVCVKLKQSGRELHGDLFTSGAICASACPYLLAGAATHEVAPDAVLGVHSTRVVLNFRGGQPDSATIAAADQRSHERADHMVAAYLAKMGIDAGLLGLARSVRFEDLHVLTREEIARFGLDRRGFVETPWRFENHGLDMMRKTAFVRAPDETSFRLLQWYVVCLDKDRFLLDFQRPVSASASLASVAIVGGDTIPVYFTGPLAPGVNAEPKTPRLEQWGLRMPRAELESLLDRPRIELTETSLSADGRRLPKTIKLSNEGGAGALDALLATCAPAKNPSALQISRPAEAVAK